jgi:hypothetical protein
MFYQSMPLYLRLTELLQVEYRLVANFPKTYKYCLGKEIITITWNMVDLFIEAQTCPSQSQEDKLMAVRTISQKNDCLKLRVRFCGDLKLISLKQQTKLNQQITEIGKMVGSWLKNA